MSKIYKKELASILSNEVNISQSKAEQYIDKTFQIITELLKEGNEVVITGFGKFFVRRSKRKVAYNPVKREKIIISHPKKKVKFVPSKTIDIE